MCVYTGEDGDDRVVLGCLLQRHDDLVVHLTTPVEHNNVNTLVHARTHTHTVSFSIAG